MFWLKNIQQIYFCWKLFLFSLLTKSYWSVTRWKQINEARQFLRVPVASATAAFETLVRIEPLPEKSGTATVTLGVIRASDLRKTRLTALPKKETTKMRYLKNKFPEMTTFTIEVVSMSIKIIYFLFPN